MKEMIHIGGIIQRKMDEERRSANWLAKKLSCTRANVYKIYNRPNIDMERLLQIGRVLNYNFFSEISDFVNENNGLSPSQKTAIHIV